MTPVYDFELSNEAIYVTPKNNEPNWTINSSAIYKNKWANISHPGFPDDGNRAVGCLGVVGCKGRKTKADCSLRRWNADAAGKYGSGWCVSSGAGCHGCTEPTFPDNVGKFFNCA